MPQSLLGNPYAIGTPNNIRIQYTPPATPDLSRSLAGLIQSQAALLRASRPVGGGGGGGRGMSVEDRIALEKAKNELRLATDAAKHTSIFKVPKGDGTFEDRAVTAPTDKERAALGQAEIKRAQQDILAKDAALQKLRADFSTLSAQGKLKVLEQIRKVEQPRLMQSTGLSAEDFAASVIAPLEAEQKKYAKEVNQGYIGKSLIDGGIMAFRSLRDAVRSIGASPAEDLAIGKATAEENQRTIESNPYLREQQRLAREGDSGWDYALDNPATAAASGIARMAPLLAPVALAPATAGGSLAALGLSAVVGGAMGAGEALSRVAEDPTLSEQQKLEGIRAAQAGQGAVGAAFGALPGPAMGLRMLGRMGGRTAPGVIRSTAEHMADNAMLGAGYAIGGNAAYNAATGAEGDITAGALDSALAGAALGLPFGARAGWRNNAARAAVEAARAREQAQAQESVPEVVAEPPVAPPEEPYRYQEVIFPEGVADPGSLDNGFLDRVSVIPPLALPENRLSVGAKRQANRRAYRNAIADINEYNNARIQSVWDAIEAQRQAQIRKANRGASRDAIAGIDEYNNARTQAAWDRVNARNLMDTVLRRTPYLAPAERLEEPQVNPYLAPLFEEYRPAQEDILDIWSRFPNTGVTPKDVETWRALQSNTSVPISPVPNYEYRRGFTASRQETPAHRSLLDAIRRQELREDLYVSPFNGMTANPASGTRVPIIGQRVDRYGRPIDIFGNYTDRLEPMRPVEGWERRLRDAQAAARQEQNARLFPWLTANTQPVTKGRKPGKASQRKVNRLLGIDLDAPVRSAAARADANSFFETLPKNNYREAYNMTLRRLTADSTQARILDSARAQLSSTELRRTKYKAVAKAVKDYLKGKRAEDVNEQPRTAETGSGSEPAPNVGRDGSIRTPGADETNILANRVVPADTTPVVEPPADTNAEPPVTGSPTPEGRGDAGATPPNPREIEAPAPVVREPEPGRAAATDGEPGGGQPAARPAEPDTGQRGAAPEDNAGTGGTRDAEPTGDRGTVEPEYVLTEAEIAAAPTHLEKIHNQITDIMNNKVLNDPKVITKHFADYEDLFPEPFIELMEPVQIKRVFTDSSIRRSYGKEIPPAEKKIYDYFKSEGVPDVEVNKEVIAKSAETARAQGFKGSDMDYALLDTRAAIKEIENKGTTNKVC